MCPAPDIDDENVDLLRHSNVPPFAARAEAIQLDLAHRQDPSEVGRLPYTVGICQQVGVYTYLPTYPDRKHTGMFIPAIVYTCRYVYTCHREHFQVSIVPGSTVGVA